VNLAGGCRVAQVGRSNLSPSASEDKPWLAPRLRARLDMIGPLHREAHIHSGYGLV
jgi:hypothetical protein